MFKFLLILVVITASTSPTTAFKRANCKKNFHKVCGVTDLITLVRQTECTETTLCGRQTSVEYCREYCQGQLTLHLEDVSGISENAFNTTNFTDFELISESRDCSPKMIDLTPESFNGLSSVQRLTLDCMKFPKTPNPFEMLGSLGKLMMKRIELRDLPQYFFLDLPKLEHLVVFGTHIASISPETFSDVAGGLKTFELVSNGLRRIERKSFERFHQLERLEISSNDLSDMQPGMFHGLGSLRELTLEYNKIGVLRRNVFEGVSELEVLCLRESKIREIEADAFAGLKIRKMDLSDNELETLPTGAFRNLGLTSLDLNYNQISFLSKDMFEGIGGMLMHLYLEDNNIGQIESHTFQGLQLGNLFLSANELKVLEKDTFNGLTVLDELDLSQNGITKITKHAFRNLTASSIQLRLNEISVVDRVAWRVPASVDKIVI